MSELDRAALQAKANAAQAGAGDVGDHDQDEGAGHTVFVKNLSFDTTDGMSGSARIKI